MFSSSCNLVFKKRQNKWQNSTDSCHVLTMNDKTFQAWSYAEVIFQYDSKLEKYIFNYYKFSNTTSNHQYALSSFLKKRVNISDIIYCNMTTLNNGFKYENLDIDAENIEVVEKYFPKKIKHFKNEIEKKDIAKKESEKLARLYKNIRNINYKSKKGLLKAIKDSRAKNREFIGVDKMLKLYRLGFTSDEITFYYFSVSEIVSFFNVKSWQKLDDKKDCIDSLKDCLKFFKDDSEKITELKNTDTHKLVERMENLNNVF